MLKKSGHRNFTFISFNVTTYSLKHNKEQYKSCTDREPCFHSVLTCSPTITVRILLKFLCTLPVISFRSLKMAVKFFQNIKEPIKKPYPELSLINRHRIIIFCVDPLFRPVVITERRKEKRIIIYPFLETHTHLLYRSHISFFSQS